MTVQDKAADVSLRYTFEQLEVDFGSTYKAGRPVCNK